ncbi:MAG: ATP-binding cassette domain-containing protein [Nitrosopumilus sp.]|nr:ATP-binding cassette domain-containing protein [Nitrosopumilus sp.]MDH3832639.1 ATP-binding cassette domain-containing protein [Nitrosopumilus sp.]
MDEIAIKLENVTKSFTFKSENLESRLFNIFSQSQKTKIMALDNITLDIKKGEVIAIIGRNGSGKTTLLRTIAGIYTPDSGNIVIDGTIAPLLHIGTGFHEELNSKENILMSGLLMGIKKDKILQKTDDIIEYAELEKFTGMKLKHYSTGMRARLAFSLALQMNPDIFLVDEILAVGDRKFQEKSFNSFVSFKEKNKTILLVTHNLGPQLEIADRVVLMDKGKIILVGDIDQVLKKYYEEYQD